jgi:hypothetical protein
VINGEAKQLSTEPLVVKGTTYLPVREIAKMLGYDVTYRADSNTIELTSASKTERNEVVETPDFNTDEGWVSYRDLSKYQIGAVIGAMHDDNFNVIGQGMVLTSGDVEIRVYFGEEIQKAIIGDIVTLGSSEGPFRIKVTADNGNFVLNVEDLKKYNLIK